MKSTAGLFNPIHPWTVQVLGEAGAAYLAKLPAAERAALARMLKRAGTTTLIVAGGQSLADPQDWSAAGIAVEHDPAAAHDVVHAYRRRALATARKTSLHGVLLHVHGIGVLIEGKAGAGKSALALDLIGRGHALVADDAVELTRPAPGILVGRSPGVIDGYLETRGLGVLDVRRMHGPGALRRSARLDLIVTLKPGRKRRLSASQRLAGARSQRRVLGEPVPVLVLPQSGHNLATLVEAACLDRRLQLDGVDAPAALAKRQARAIKKRQGP